MDIERVERHEAKVQSQPAEGQGSRVKSQRLEVFAALWPTTLDSAPFSNSGSGLPHD